MMQNLLQGLHRKRNQKRTQVQLRGMPFVQTVFQPSHASMLLASH